MNGDGLAAQAKGLPARSQMALGLVLAWLLQPFLRFDDTPHGQQRGDACRGLLDQALGDVEAGPSATLVEDVASTEEQRLEEERDGPGAFGSTSWTPSPTPWRVGRAASRPWDGVCSESRRPFTTLLKRAWRSNLPDLTVRS